MRGQCFIVSLVIDEAFQAIKFRESLDDAFPMLPHAA